MWCGVVWCGVVWCGVAWCGVVGGGGWAFLFQARWGGMAADVFTFHQTRCGRVVPGVCFETEAGSWGGTLVCVSHRLLALAV